MNEELLYLSASELAHRIRIKKLTSQELVETHIHEIIRVNPSIHAVVATRFDEARKEAKLADEKTSGTHMDDLPPLHGVPCTIKESFALTGMPNSSGLVSRKGMIATSDATSVARLRNAGAIPLGVTNTSELCMWMESYNKVYGRTNNPYDFTRICGGSSGGEGAIIGAGASPFGLGSDIGGSIRMPAFFNGVFGHKATGGLIPNTGQFPLPFGDNARYAVTGPLARRACDLPLLVSLLAEPDGICEGAKKIPLGQTSSVNIRKLDVLSIPDDGGLIFVSKELRDAQKKVEQWFESKGVRVRRKRIRGMHRAIETWAACIGQSKGQTYQELMGNGTNINILNELQKAFQGKSPFTFPSLVLVLIESLTKKMINLDDLSSIRDEIREDLIANMGDHSVFLFPSHAWVAPKHRVPLFLPFLFAYTAILNVLEVPSTQVPLGLNSKGIPLGIQVGSTYGNDHLTMAVAIELEKAFGGWVRPSI